MGMSLGRIVYACVGWCALGLGTAGMFVPGLPTTVFVLVAAYCFSKSSPRLAAWLARHPWFGPTVTRFERQGGLSPTAKRRALCAMWTAILVSSTVLLAASPVAAIATLAAGLLGTLAILFAVRTVHDTAGDTSS